MSRLQIAAGSCCVIDIYKNLPVSISDTGIFWVRLLKHLHMWARDSMHMGPHPIVTAVSHNVGMLLRLSLYGVGACVCRKKSSRVCWRRNRWNQYGSSRLGWRPWAAFNSDIRRSPVSGAWLRNSFCVPRPLYADDLLFISDSNLTILWTAASKYSIIIS